MYIFLGLVVAALSFFIFYLIIKAAVKNGTIEAHRTMNFQENVSIGKVTSKKICPVCTKEHKGDLNVCPRCSHKYTE